MSRIDRRSIVKGFSLGASSLLLSPIVNRLEAHAAGETKRPVRFVFVVEGNGLVADHIQPEGLPRKKNAQGHTDFGKVLDRKLSELALPRALEPLAEFKDRIGIIQGLSGRICGGGHSNNYGALGAYPGKLAPPLDETIDVALGKAHPGIFTQVGLGISDRPEHGIIYNISAWGPGKAMPVQCRPDSAYASLFGSAAEGAAGKDFQSQSNLLDFMVDDIKRLESRLAGEERAKLGGYLEAYESLRNRQSRLNEIKNTLREHAPVVNDKFKSEIETDRLDAHFDLAAASLIGGLTNVVTIASGCGDPYFSVKFGGLGIGIGKHGIGHGGSDAGRPWDELSIMIRRFHMELTARLAKKLQAIPEGDGTMLDNTLIVYLSDSAESHHSRCWEWPLVTIGNLGGRLKLADRYLAFPKYGEPEHRTTANFYNALLHAAGVSRERFGKPDPNLKEIDQASPLAQITL